MAYFEARNFLIMQGRGLSNISDIAIDDNVAVLENNRFKIEVITL